MPVAIKIENLSKQYRLGLVSTRTLSHDLNRWYQMNIRGKDDPYLKIGEVNDRAVKGQSDYIWALRDINLEVEQGEVLGIIGKNGAGKSTLLKILSKVTAPTTGSIKARGRIASLLEIGTGFHQEMTGRENIYLNGAIMGMTKAEITRKMDEIIDFAGVERYIDTPVKRYSSGMTVRLGFAVAAYLDPEILVVDEVLAVGDAEFQKKAIGKMQDISKGQGRTVLFVSHNMAAIKELCYKGLLIRNGQIIKTGNVGIIVEEYLRDSTPLSNYVYNGDEKNPYGYFTKIQLYNAKGECTNKFKGGENSYIIMEYILKQNFKNYNTGLIVKDTFENNVYSSADSDLNPEIQFFQNAGQYSVKIPLPLYNINTGFYKIEFLMGIINTHLFDKVELDFTIENRNFLNSGVRPGILFSLNKWEYKK